MFYTIDGRKLTDGFLALCLVLAALLLVQTAGKLETTGSGKSGVPPCLVIDPGHGGLDGGAIAFNGVKESDINLAIALKLNGLAAFWGVDTKLTRSDDMARTDYQSYSEHEDLVYRTNLVNSVENGALISIHHNFYPTSQPSGSQVLYAVDDRSRRLGQQTHHNLVQFLQPENRRVAEPAPERLYLTSHVNCPAILVECGFLSNITDLDLLVQEKYQTSLATVLLASYLQFLSWETYT